MVFFQGVFIAVVTGLIVGFADVGDVAVPQANEVFHGGDAGLIAVAENLVVFGVDFV